MQFTVLVLQEGTFEVEADSLEEAQAVLDTYGEVELESAVDWVGGFRVSEVSVIPNN